jgi:hypothetical protein
MSYGSYSGAFATVNLPVGPSWQTTYSPSNLTLLVTDLYKLAITTAPAGTNAGAILSPVVVQIEDVITGNPVPTNGVPMTMALSTGSGTLSGTLTRNSDATGKATFNDLSINLVGTKTLQASATASGIVPVTSGSFTITYGAPAQVALIAPVGSLQENGVTFSPAAVVQVQDQFGNAVSNSTAPITAIFSSTGHGSLAGTIAVNANGTNGAAIFTNLHYNLGNATTGESVVLSFTAPGLIPATNNALSVAFVFTLFSLTNGNSVVQVDPGTQQGMLSWSINGVGQLYQKWFWLSVGSNTAPISFDALSPPFGLSSLSPSNAAISYFPQGLNATLEFTLTGGAPGSDASSLAESISVQNTNSTPIYLHLFAYSDFDLAGDPEDDTISFPITNTAVQQGKGMTMTETVETPTPNEWEGGWYDFTLENLVSGSPVTLSDNIIPQAPGDQTFAYQWDIIVAARQTLAINLTDSLQSAGVLLDIELSAGNVTISWPTNGTSLSQLYKTSALGSGGDWSAVTNSPVIAGQKYQVIAPLSGQTQFFRLER